MCKTRRFLRKRPFDRSSFCDFPTGRRSESRMGTAHGGILSWKLSNEASENHIDVVGGYCPFPSGNIDTADVFRFSSLEQRKKEGKSCFRVEVIRIVALSISFDDP